MCTCKVHLDLACLSISKIILLHSKNNVLFSDLLLAGLIFLTLSALQILCNAAMFKLVRRVLKLVRPLCRTAASPGRLTSLYGSGNDSGWGGSKKKLISSGKGRQAAQEGSDSEDSEPEARTSKRSGQDSYSSSNSDESSQESQDEIQGKGRKKGAAQKRVEESDSEADGSQGYDQNDDDDWGGKPMSSMRNVFQLPVTIRKSGSALRNDGRPGTSGSVYKRERNAV